MWKDPKLHLSKKIRALDNGRRSEQQALKFLESKGLTLIASNLRYKFGELDLIMLEQQTIIFVEVKYRRHESYGGALHSLGQQQAIRLQRCAKAWLQKHDPQSKRACRFDLVALSGNFSDTECVWIKNIFQ